MQESAVSVLYNTTEAKKTTRRVFLGAAGAAVILADGKIELTAMISGATLSNLVLLNDTERRSPFWNEARAMRAAEGSGKAAGGLGHFLCPDEFDAPSQEELKSGYPFHGQANSRRFEIQESQKTKQFTHTKMAARHVIVFQHHPFFVDEAQEPNQFGNISLDRRQPMLALLRGCGVRWVFAGHIHRYSVGKDGKMEMVAVGPVAMPFGEDGSGLLLAQVTGTGVQYRYYDFGRLPNKAVFGAQ